MKKITLVAVCALFSNSLFSQQWSGAATTIDPIARSGTVTIGSSSGSGLLNVGGELNLSTNSLFGDPKISFGRIAGGTRDQSLSNFTLQYLTDDFGGTSIPVNAGFYAYPSHAHITADGSIPVQSKVFYISYNGKIGMGTNDINASLNDGYRLFVKDGIKTEKVKVEIAASNGWADYVFKDDYKLMSLNDLDRFIKTNGHLPEVPTTEQAIANGIELKEMNILLLKKVEELTLYTLQQHKLLQEQSKRLQKLENMVNPTE